MNKYENIERAIKFLSSHMGTMEELWKPTLLHSINVWSDLFNSWYDENIVIAGFLHDIIEDTKINSDIIEKEFWQTVLMLILSNSKNLDLSKEERDQDLYNRCLKHWKDAMIIKAADIFDNYKYFSGTNDLEKFERSKKLLNMFLSVLPSDYNDPIFNRLKNLS